MKPVHVTFVTFVRFGEDVKYLNDGDSGIMISEEHAGIRLTRGGEAVLVPWHRVDLVRYAAPAPAPAPAPEAPKQQDDRPAKKPKSRTP